MTISQVGKKYGLTPDTLRYYERLGLIPPIRKNASGLRDYQDADLRWVEFIKCMRGAGVSIETLIEFVALFRQGPSTIQARKALLEEQRKQIVARVDDLLKALDRLDTKLERYEERMMQVENSLTGEPD